MCEAGTQTEDFSAEGADTAAQPTEGEGASTTPGLDAFEALFIDAEERGKHVCFPALISYELFRQHAGRRASDIEITHLLHASHTDWRRLCLGLEVGIRAYLEARGEVEPIESEPGSDGTYESESSASGDEEQAPCEA